MAFESEEPASDGGSGDTIGVEMALERARGGHDRDPIADALLTKQTEKLEHELHHLKLRTIAEWFGLVLKGLGVAVALTAVIAVGLLAFEAITSRVQVVEPFHVPPGMAEKGLDGSVLASQVLDKLNDMYAATEKQVQSTGYSGEQATETKLEIPETGVSLGELQRLLQTWLGHDTRISGSLVRQGDTLVLTTRTGAVAKSVSGSEADLDKLTMQAAESIYQTTQPLSYVDYLRTNRRFDEAEGQLKRLTSDTDIQTRAWAYTELGELLERHRDLAGAQHAMDEAVALSPNLWVVWNNLADLHNFFMSDEETALAYRRKAVAATDYGGADANAAQHFHLDDQVYIDEQEGDFRHALTIIGAEAGVQKEAGLAFQAAYLAAYEAAYMHDLGLSQTWTRRAMDYTFAMQGPDLQTHNPVIVGGRLAYWQLAITSDWAAAANVMAKVNTNSTQRSDYWLALQANALVGAGRIAEARVLLAPMTQHCFYCLIARGRLAEASHDRAGADRYFAALARDYPSIVRGQENWGRVKLMRGDYDGAIVIFTHLNKLGPRNPEALEGWGEALLRKGDIAGAAKKLSLAATYAPGWGRLHLAWGIALKTLGRKTEAEKQFAAADGLALTQPERALLASSR